MFTAVALLFFHAKSECLYGVLEECLLHPKLTLGNGSVWVEDFWLLANSPVKAPTVGRSLLPGGCLAMSHGRRAWPGSRRPVAVLQGAALFFSCCRAFNCGRA